MSIPESSFNVPNITPRICCNRSGPSSYKWKEYAVKVVKLCDVLGLTNWSALIKSGPSRRDFQGSIGFAILIGVCAIGILGGVTSLVLSVAGASFHAVWLLSIVAKCALLGGIYFTTLGVLGGIAALTLRKTQPSQQQHQAYILSSIQGWLENNELEKVYSALPALDFRSPIANSQGEKALVDRLVEKGCTDLSVLSRLLEHISLSDRDACYENIARKMYEKDHDVNLVLPVLKLIHDDIKRDELSQFYATRKVKEKAGGAVEEEQIPRVGRVGTEVVRFTDDLTALEKADLDPHFIDDYRLTIAFRNHPEITMTIRRQNIFASGAQVIVNAANSHLGGGGGIDGAIHQEGGTSYAQAHRELKVLYKSNYTEGYAAMIGSGDLSEKYQIENVIVVAGPAGLVTPTKETQLYSCYFNALEVADAQNKTSIAFPSISTGIFGFPKDRAAAISLKAIKDFLSKHPQTALKTISIHFLPTDPKANLEIYRDHSL